MSYCNYALTYTYVKIFEGENEKCDSGNINYSYEKNRELFVWSIVLQAKKFSYILFSDCATAKTSLPWKFSDSYTVLKYRLYVAM